MKLILMVLIAALMSSCTTNLMKLEDMKEDIPVKLLESYNNSEELYVDTEALRVPMILPVLSFGSGYVSKTKLGFDAKRSFTMGFGLICYALQKSHFDGSGAIESYSIYNSNFIGLFKVRCSMKKDKKAKDFTYLFLSRSILWGCFGKQVEISDEKTRRTMRLFWLPIRY
ncbi:MAG: hypothetical protein MJH11_07215 [Lentisphaeria bacterium]|nr:hypothetical protein [Lentisphaeria bacterium]